MTRSEYFGDYLLRHCASDDLPTLVALERDCQSDHWPLERVEAFVATPHPSCEQFGILAFLKGQAVGYALLLIGGGNLAIERMGVLPSHRRNRVGTKLVAMGILEGKARSLEFMVAVVRESNLVAQQFYRACGFRAGRMTWPLKGWFGSEDAIAMRRPVELPLHPSTNSTDSSANS